MSKEVIYTFSDLAKEYSKDQSYVAKLVKEFNLNVTPAIHGKHACLALSQKEKDKLEKSNPLLVLPLIKKNEKDLSTIAKERKQDISGLLKFLKANGFTLVKRLKPDGGRAVNVLDASEYERLMTTYPPRVKVT